MLALFLMMGAPARAYADPIPVTESSGIAFPASPDHHTLSHNGQPMLTNYRFNIFAQTGPNIGLFTSQNLLKPDPNAQGEIVVKPLTSFGSLVDDIVYTSTVDAVGPGGASASSPSEPFCTSSKSKASPKHWQATCDPVGDADAR